MGGIHVPARSAADRAERRRPRRGFTLIELMVVILIIGVVVAIVFPVLTGARNAARKAGTTALMTDLASASTQFYSDHNRYPGYFSPLEMGHNDNIARGFTAMENIILDLSGGIVGDNVAVDMGNNDPSDEANGPQVVNVGPLNDTARDVRVDLRRIGAASEESKRYWQPDKKNYVRQSATGKQETNVVGHRALPDVVDAWGTPILAWAQDEPGAAENVHFALKSYSGGANADRARYYWASNAGFLNSKDLGKLARNQPETNVPVAEDLGFSLVGARTNEDALKGTLAGFLGHPAYPDPDPANPSPMNDSTPKIGRSAILFHSAGADGYYLGSGDIGGKRAGVNRVVKYNPPAPAATPGAPVPRQPDPIEGFDDLIVNAGSSN